MLVISSSITIKRISVHKSDTSLFALLFFIMCAVVPVQQCRKRGHAAAAVWAEDDLAHERELDLDYQHSFPSYGIMKHLCFFFSDKHVLVSYILCLVHSQK